MTFNVHNTQDYLSQEALDYLRQNDCQVRFRKWEGLPDQEAVMCREIRGVHAVIAGGEDYTRKVFEAADRLKIVARTGAGYEHVDLGAARGFGVWVTNTPGATGSAVAEFTVGLILSLLRNIHGMASSMKHGKWEKYQGRELGGLALGVVGTGSIGKHLIRLASGFGTRILAYDTQPESALVAKWKMEYLPLDDLMAQSDIVSINVPLNGGTRGMIDDRRLGLMKRTAYLVNTSRAAVVDREALLRMLREDQIAGAALDVHDPAPCLPDDPLASLENVLATPWSAFNTQEAIERMSIEAARDVVGVLLGREPEHPVGELEAVRTDIAGP